MPLSTDEDKRARQLANLRRGPAAMEKKFGLEVIDYLDAAPAPKPKSSNKPAPTSETRPGPPATEPSGGVSSWLVFAGGLAGLLVLIVLMNQTGGARV